MAQPESGPSLFNLITTAGDTAGAEAGTVKRALQVIRSHLGMDVAYVSVFVGNTSVFHEVDAPGFEALIKPGNSMSLDDIYCRYVLEGRLPQLMPDTSVEPITTAVPIGKHLSVPIRLPDGSTYGMFCCLGREASPSLNERDMQMMRAFAELAAYEIAREQETKKEAEERRIRIENVIAAERLAIVYQPIWHVAKHIPLGLECLARFSAEPQRTPDLWFKEAADSGLGVELELAAIRMAFAAFATLPGDAYLAVNASPATILSPEFSAVLGPLQADRVVVEVTEHAHVDDYDQLLETLAPLRARRSPGGRRRRSRLFQPSAYPPFAA